MERGSSLLTDGRPDRGEPMPHRLRDRTGEHDMAEVVTWSMQPGWGHPCVSGVPLPMCLRKAPTKSLPCRRRQAVTRPGLPSAEEWTADHLWLHCELAVCDSAIVMRSTPSAAAAARSFC